MYAKWSKSDETEPDSTPEPEVTDEWADPFIDVDKSDWFYEAVKEMNIKGIFSGITEDRFAPDENITRAMAVTVLWRMDGENDAKDQQLTFNDVDPQGYYSDAVRWGVSTGIVQGYSDISFGPDRLIYKVPPISRSMTEMTGLVRYIQVPAFRIGKDRVRCV